MHIHCLGLNHRTTDIGLREKLAFSDESTKTALARLGCGGGTCSDAVSEMVILSTCNRVEIYAVAPTLDFAALERFLSDTQGVPVDEFHYHLYRLADIDAVDHLFRVSAGLDSLVIGEPQILGQVMSAFELARSQGTTGAVLSRLFHSALHAGKRTRSETAISTNPASISSVAIRLAGQVVTNLSGARVAVLGAGEMAELAVEALQKRGVSQILVVNRTLERAQRLAERWGGQAMTFEKLPQALLSADILIASTGAPHIILHANMVATAMQERPGRPLVVIDIAVPRDVDDAVGLLPGVSLYDMDQLQQHLEDSLARRVREIPQVEVILAEERAAFRHFLHELDVIPLIAEMRQQAEVIRTAELEKTLRRLGDLTPEERLRLEAMTQALVKKLLHTPITRLRAEAGTPRAAETAAAARNLFGL